MIRTSSGEFDYVCTVGETLYAFEHTGIEPFPNQIRLADHNQKLFGSIINCFDHRADQEIWDLYVPVDASAGLTGDEVGRAQNSLIRWIETNARRIPVAQRYGRHANAPLGESASDVPFRFSLHRTISPASDSPLCGRFFLGPIAPANLEEQRVARLRTSLPRANTRSWPNGSGIRVREQFWLWRKTICG